LLTAEIHVTLKDGVLDPQGTTLRRSMEGIGYHDIGEVRMGKLIQIQFTGSDRKQVEETVDKLCRTILTNPVIEKYSFTVGESK
jgi:phosphoribosylformylglycinamidine synthase PurS subunit